MAKINCTLCGKRMITEKILTAHMAKSHPFPEGAVNPEFAPSVEAPVEVPVEPSKITLNFNQPVEVQINGLKYEGRTIEVQDMATASEIVRIAKEAYGWDVLM